MATFKYNHVHLTSPDPLKTAEFYEKNFGATRVNATKIDGNTSVEFNLGGAGGRLLIIERPGTAIKTGDVYNSGLEHFGMSTDNLDEAVAILKKAGVKFKGEPIRVMPWGLRLSFFWAPENVLIEMLEIK